MGEKVQGLLMIGRNDRTAEFAVKKDLANIIQKHCTTGSNYC